MGTALKPDHKTDTRDDCEALSTREDKIVTRQSDLELKRRRFWMRRSAQPKPTKQEEEQVERNTD